MSNFFGTQNVFKNDEQIEWSHWKHHSPKFLKARSCKVSEQIELENIHLAKIGVLLDMELGLNAFILPETNEIVSQNHQLSHHLW